MTGASPHTSAVWRLASLGVEMRTRWRWTGWAGDALRFDTPEGPQLIKPQATVLALGGASWARLGSVTDPMKGLSDNSICANNISK